MPFLATVPGAIIGSAVVGGVGSYLSSREQSKANQAALGSIYRPPGLDRMADMTHARIMEGMGPPPLNLYDPQVAHNLTQQAQTMTSPGSPYQQHLEQYLQGAFNPQLDPAYNQMIQGVRGATSARGLTSSPYGAGMEGLAAQQWGMGQRERQAQALQNYMAGQGGVQTLGTNALQSALGLQQAQHQWNMPFIQAGLGYIGQGQAAGGQMAALQQAAGQQAAAPWAQVAQAGAGLAGDLLKYKLMP